MPPGPWDFLEALWGVWFARPKTNLRVSICLHAIGIVGCGWPVGVDSSERDGALPVALMIHDNSSDRTAFVPATHHSNFCPINFRCWTLGWVDRSASGVHRLARPFCRRCAPGLNWPGRASGAVTLKKLECSKQAYALDTLAWDNTTGF
ncbi:hypothetical protein VNO78_36698 [Psophocarpus tetragonolobus]|uniref:Uncharacterized protein n=1 Tax=Psophocarpus tetragonolobus TaxID=3891 RepID=A0AAN9NF01_PSOTE